MRVLAFDCSTSTGSVAVVEDGAVCFAEAFDAPRGRGGAFFETLDRAVKSGRPDRIVVGIGPGSYNGLRTAITAAEGLAFATGSERVGVLSVRALPCDAPEYVAVADARGGTFSWARISNRTLVGEVELIPAGELHRRLAAESAPVFSPVFLADGISIATPDAVILAGLGGSEPPARGLLEPFYLKPVHITQPRRREP